MLRIIRFILLQIIFNHNIIILREVFLQHLWIKYLNKTSPSSYYFHKFIQFVEIFEITIYNDASFHNLVTCHPDLPSAILLWLVIPIGRLPYSCDLSSRFAVCHTLVTCHPNLPFAVLLWLVIPICRLPYSCDLSSQFAVCHTLVTCHPNLPFAILLWLIIGTSN